jgi:DNA-binding LytR/AlgR family response regulator
MPGTLDGIALARAAVARRSSLKVLLTTGYAERVLDGNAADHGFPLLPKPYRSFELASRIRAVLDSAPGAAAQPPGQWRTV